MSLKKENLEVIENSIANILTAIGEDTSREGLLETPKRVAKMYEEIFEGIQYTNEDISKMYGKCFSDETSDMVVIKNIPSYSYCEHHMALMFDMKISVGYVPNGQVIGLSKIPRITHMVCKRLQVQERIGRDIYSILKLILKTEDIIIKIESDHACVRTRGVRSELSSTVTYFSGGVFKSEPTKEDFFRLSDDKV